MRNLFVSFAVFCLSVLPLRAQVQAGYDLPENSIRVEYGILTPMGTISNTNYKFTLLSFTHRFSGNRGFRTGVQYGPENTGVRTYVGMPLAFLYRVQTSSYEGLFTDNVRYDEVWDDSKTRQVRANAFSNFLLLIFQRAEAFAGITPGYLFGNATGATAVHGMATSDGKSQLVTTSILLNDRFYLSADAGVVFIIPIWRLNIYVTPAFHYLFTNNFSEYRQAATVTEIKPIRWQASWSGGLSFLF